MFLFAWCYEEVASRIFAAVLKWMGLIAYTVATHGRLLHISFLIVHCSLHPCICLQTEKPERIRLVWRVCRGYLVTINVTSTGQNMNAFYFRANASLSFFSNCIQAQCSTSAIRIYEIAMSRLAEGPLVFNYDALAGT